MGRLRARRDELVQAIFARVRGDAFGAAGVHDAEYVEGLRAAVAVTVDFALEGIERGEGWAGPVPVVALEQARRAARVGVGLETVLRRYVLGSSLLGEVIMEEADRGEGDQSPPAPLDRRIALRGALRAQAAVLDRLLQAVTAAYGDELSARGARLSGVAMSGCGGCWMVVRSSAQSSTMTSMRGISAQSPRAPVRRRSSVSWPWAWIAGC